MSKVVTMPGQCQGSNSPPSNTALLTTGMLQIIGAAMLIISGTVLSTVDYEIQYRNKYDNIAIAIWGGAFVFSTGFNGMWASRSSCRRHHIVYMVMSLVSVCMSIGISTIAAVAAADNVHYWKKHPGYYHEDDGANQEGISITKLGFHLFVGLVGCFTLIVSILAIQFACMAKCSGEQKTCCKKPELASDQTNLHPPEYNPAYQP